MRIFYYVSFVSERGCPAAALRVWPWRTREKTPIELCGDTLDTYKQILSETNVLQLSFYLADKAVGAKGFKATWTEIKVNWAIKESKIPLNYCSGCANMQQPIRVQM